jgi:hypothetical protein
MVRPPKHGARVKSTAHRTLERPRTPRRIPSTIAGTAAILLFAASEALAGQWAGPAFHDESTLEFRTTNAEGEGHWSTVWMVVLDDQVYVNLGERAVERLKTNTAAPLVSVRIDGQEFDEIVVEAAQDRQPAVAQAIADKYWTGFLVPHRRPSTVMRLRPE